MVRLFAPYVTLVVVIGLLVWRWKFAPVLVEVHEIKTGPMGAETMGTGTLEARVKATISPKIQGRLAELLVDQNDAISAGQLLARLDDGELKQQVQVAQAALAAAQAGVERLRADEARGLAVEEQARLNHQRVSELLLTHVAARSDLDKAVEQLNVAVTQGLMAGERVLQPLESGKRTLRDGQKVSHP